MLRLFGSTILGSVARRTASGRKIYKKALSSLLSTAQNQLVRKRRQSLLHLLVVGLSVGLG
jgi:hypothetical protein